MPIIRELTATLKLGRGAAPAHQQECGDRDDHDHSDPKRPAIGGLFRGSWCLLGGHCRRRRCRRGRRLGGRLSRRLSRRLVIGASAAAVVGGAAGAGLWSMHFREERRFDDLFRRGEQGLEYGDLSTAPAEYLRRAVAIRPNDAAAQGLLAFAFMVNADSVNGKFASEVDDAQQAASASLRIDPNEPNARLALVELQRSTLDLAGTEDRIRQVLAAAPRNIFAMRQLWNLLQSTGRSREALALVRRAIAVKPLAAANNFPLAQLLCELHVTPPGDRR